MLPKLHGRTIAIDTHDLHVFEIDLDIARLGEALVAFLAHNNPITIHSQEATLEEIFLLVTGKELTA